MYEIRHFTPYEMIKWVIRAYYRRYCLTTEEFLFVIELQLRGTYNSLFSIDILINFIVIVLYK